MNNPSTQFSRKSWIDACEFHALDNRQVLDRVIESAHQLAQGRAAVLLDLDSTLYEVGPRTGHILKEWLASPESREFPEVREAVEKLKPEQVGYSLEDTFVVLALEAGSGKAQAALQSMKKFWFARFFTNEYLDHDIAYPGAAEFVQELYKTGIDLIYLTGRDEPGMGIGTRKRLIQDLFPWEQPRTHLLLKKNFELDDLEHKSAAADYVRGVGTLVASFENEPPNLIALSDLFEESMHVFVDTVYSERVARPKRGLYRITDYHSFRA
ncbi:MAG: HAD family hydrolase [Proteobacteria bacterium]|nr:MAG: HAD family hydrolase [Pseudomonadota bacterium]